MSECIAEYHYYHITSLNCELASVHQFLKHFYIVARKRSRVFAPFLAEMLTEIHNGVKNLIVTLVTVHTFHGKYYNDRIDTDLIQTKKNNKVFSR